jgi:hypothetical protein
LNTSTYGRRLERACAMNGMGAMNTCRPQRQVVRVEGRTHTPQSCAEKVLWTNSVTYGFQVETFQYTSSVSLELRVV